jgi:hypothetical protein
MELVPFIVVMAVAVVSVCLTLVAFALAERRGGLQKAMRPDARGHWPAPMVLMFIGVLLDYAVVLALCVPGVSPFWDHSSPYTAWGQGVVFGWLIGIGLPYIYRKVSLARREHQSGVDRAPQA